MIARLMILGALLFAPAAAAANEADDVRPLYSLDVDEFRQMADSDPDWLAVDLPLDIRKWFRNPDGSCVQCSNGMLGVDQNVPAFAFLLWDTQYGPAERGGSNPSRVARYARERGVKIWNVTGSPTFEFMRWACRNGRGAAIGAGSAHFQTLMGHKPAAGQWAVCNNNSPHRIDVYSDVGFSRLHLASGRWCVILDYPPHPATPRVVEWWR